MMAAAMHSTALPEQVHPKLEQLVAPHINSFDYFLGDGLRWAVSDLDRVEIEVQKQKMSWWIEEVNIGYPSHPNSSVDDKVFPSEVRVSFRYVLLLSLSRQCRQGHFTYSAPMVATVCCQVSGHQVERFQKRLGHVPLMVKVRENAFLLCAVGNALLLLVPI